MRFEEYLKESGLTPAQLYRDPDLHEDIVNEFMSLVEEEPDEYEWE
ncbi:hypothetical protein [Laceyella putida]|uniref:Uncharacterized protein n=1 Tax=Laceyella putida TaxID=110101 RepID=A0ABW2RR41_9BACL